MKSDFEKCLQSKRIVRQEHAHNLVPAEFEDAKNDLERAKRTFKDSDYKWATIQAYYTMFHAARALLFAKGYREKSHFCLKAAIQALYADQGTLDPRFVKEFDTTMLLRETADYKRDFSKEGAEIALQNAERFLAEVNRILKGLV